MENLCGHPLIQPSEVVVDVGGRDAEIEHWFSTVGQAWEAVWRRDLQAFVVRDTAKGEAFQITRFFDVCPSALETTPAQAWMHFAPMDADGVGGMSNGVPLKHGRIEASLQLYRGAVEGVEAYANSVKAILDGGSSVS
jgi:hypothetical protein